MTTSYRELSTELTINGWPISRLAARVGRTPFFVYDRSTLLTQIESVRKALPSRAKLFYSLKANPFPPMLHYISRYVDGMDVASPQELALVLNTGIEPLNCLFTGPGKTQEDIHSAVASGVTVNIESVAQAQYCADSGERLGSRPAVSLRLNCSFTPNRTAMHNTEHNQFGVDPVEAPAILREIANLDLNFRGFHAFWGSQFTDPEVIARCQSKAYALAASLVDLSPTLPSFINVGGGIGARFFADEAPVHLDAIGTAIHAWVANARALEQPWELVFEFGRYLAANSGHYVTRVLDRKTIGDETFLITDGGINHFLLASGAFAQKTPRSFVVVLANKLDQPPIERVTVVGRLCSIMDRFATRVSLPVAEPGDFIVLPNAGAYGASFSPVGFLSHPPAIELLV